MMSDTPGYKIAYTNYVYTMANIHKTGIAGSLLVTALLFQTCV